MNEMDIQGNNNKDQGEERGVEGRGTSNISVITCTFVIGFSYEVCVCSMAFQINIHLHTASHFERRYYSIILPHLSIYIILLA